MSKATATRLLAQIALAVLNTVHPGPMPRGISNLVSEKPLFKWRWKKMCSFY